MGCDRLHPSAVLLSRRVCSTCLTRVCRIVLFAVAAARVACCCSWRTTSPHTPVVSVSPERRLRPPTATWVTHSSRWCCCCRDAATCAPSPRVEPQPRRPYSDSSAHRTCRRKCSTRFRSSEATRGNGRYLRVMMPVVLAFSFLVLLVCVLALLTHLPLPVLTQVVRRRCRPPPSRVSPAPVLRLVAVESEWRAAVLHRPHVRSHAQHGGGARRTRPRTTE